MFFINPFIYAAGGDFESIATVTVSSGGASSITFSSIPGTYQHLQVRLLLRNTSPYSDMAPTFVNLNSDATSSNYARHTLAVSGSTAYAQGGSNTPHLGFGEVNANSLANVFCAHIVDILDYGSTTKNTTMRFITGADFNGSGSIGIQSMLWLNTSAVTAIQFRPWDGVFAQHTTAALYGIKAP